MEIVNQLSVIGVRVEMVALVVLIGMTAVVYFGQVQVARQLHADGFLKLGPTLAWTAATAVITTLISGSLAAVATTVCVLLVLNIVGCTKRANVRNAAMREAQWKAAEPYYQALWAQQNAQQVIEKARRTCYPTTARRVERIS